MVPKARPAAAVLMMCWALCGALAAQSCAGAVAQAGHLDLSFNPGSGIDDGTVTSLAVQSDGRILVGGYFSSFDHFPRYALLRLNRDGTVDNSYWCKVAGHLHGVSALEGHESLIVGDFHSINEQPQHHVARLRSDGSVDPTFKPPLIFRGQPGIGHVDSAVIQQDGKIVIAGDFDHINDTVRQGLARLGTDGELDPTFDPRGGASGHLGAVALEEDGRVLVAGGFTQFDSISLNGVVRLNSDGTIDSGFDPGSGISGPAGARVSALAVQPDGKIVVGGSFTGFDGHRRPGIARLNRDGTLDTAFDPGDGATGDPASEVKAIVLQSNDRILVGGRFTRFNGTPRNRITRLTFDGSIDLDFDPGRGVDGTWVYVIALQPDGNVLIGGDFHNFDGATRGGVARIFSGSLTLEMVEWLPRGHAGVGFSNSTSWPFQIEQSSDLKAWFPVERQLPISGASTSLVHIAAPNAASFYRAVLVTAQ